MRTMACRLRTRPTRGPSAPRPPPRPPDVFPTLTVRSLLQSVIRSSNSVSSASRPRTVPPSCREPCAHWARACVLATQSSPGADGWRSVLTCRRQRKIAVNVATHVLGNAHWANVWTPGSPRQPRAHRPRAGFTLPSQPVRAWWCGVVPRPRGTPAPVRILTSIRVSGAPQAWPMCQRRVRVQPRCWLEPRWWCGVGSPKTALSGRAGFWMWLPTAGRPFRRSTLRRHGTDTAWCTRVRRCPA